MLSRAIATQSKAVQHAFDFDVTQGGQTYTDADGDTLTYSIQLGASAVTGLRIEGTRIVGVPVSQGNVSVSVEVSDGHGHTASTQFTVAIGPNSPPAVTQEFSDVLVAAGASVNLDASQHGQFSDADGDVLRHVVAVRGGPGLTVNGLLVTGSLEAGKASEVTVTARDDFGGELVAKFLVAAPVPVPGAPTQQVSGYLYRDYDLNLTGMGPSLTVWNSGNDVPTNAGATLGRVLFYDKRLSITNTVACASCHRQDHAFATPNRVDVGVLGLPLRRNSMGLSNARHNFFSAFFWDMRVRSLREVAQEALTTADEMGAKLPAVEAKLRATSFYPPLFEAAFGSREITGERVLLALQEFVRALISYQSRYDRICLAVPTSTANCSSEFTAQEELGRQLFDNNVRVPCHVCHQTVNHRMVWQANNGIDDQVTDPGALRSEFSRGKQGVFRAPSLRNIARTAPYMHDGRFATLREVIEHYDHGIKQSEDLDVFLGGGGPVAAQMNLSEEEKDALIAFLNSLTDEEMLNDPKFSDPFR